MTMKEEKLRKRSTSARLTAKLTPLEIARSSMQEGRAFSTKKGFASHVQSQGTVPNYVGRGIGASGAAGLIRRLITILFCAGCRGGPGVPCYRRALLDRKV